MPRKKNGGIASAPPQTTLTIQPLLGKQAAEVEQSLIEPPDGGSSIASALEKAFGPIILSSPTIAGALQQRGKYVVEFSTGGARALRRGKAYLLPRVEGGFQPTLLTRTGKFLENAKIVPGVALVPRPD
jgi:hypothetical protein